MSLADDVREFHTAAGIVGRQTPGIPTEDRIRARMRFIAEEFVEALDAIFTGHPALIDAREALDAAIAQADIAVDLPEFADALGDLDYVVEGTRQEFGIDGPPIAKAIHAANMAKFPNGVAKIIDGKIQKPADWRPPNIVAELCAQGWGREQKSTISDGKAKIVNGLIYFGDRHVGYLTHSANVWTWRIWLDVNERHSEYSVGGYTDGNEARRCVLAYVLCAYDRCDERNEEIY